MNAPEQNLEIHEHLQCVYNTTGTPATPGPVLDSHVHFGVSESPLLSPLEKPGKTPRSPGSPREAPRKTPRSPLEKPPPPYTPSANDTRHFIAASGGDVGKAGGVRGGAPWRLRLGLIRAQHLPKMHVQWLSGTADPYVTFDIAGKAQQRPTKKKY